MTETIFAGKMPILALRGLCVFPEQTVHFEVGRSKSVKALEAAMQGDQTLLLIPQKDLLVDDPTLKDLYAVGCIAKVKQVLKTQGENLRILVTGISPGQDHRAVSERAVPFRYCGIGECGGTGGHHSRPRAAPGGQFPVWRVSGAVRASCPDRSAADAGQREQRLYCRLYRPEFRH